jgi:exosortase sorting signal-containing protein
MKLIYSLLFAVCIFALFSSPSHANNMYAAGHSGSNGLSTFYHIDAAGETAIGPVGFERCGGMDFHPVTKVLYALCERADGSDIGVLITINLGTGAGTEIGPTGISGDISDISFRNSDGVLFAEHVVNDPDHTLYTININTGQAALVGNTGLSGTGGNGMSFNLDDTLYLQTTDDIPELYTMNQISGQAQLLKNVTFPPPDSEQDRFKALDTDPRSGAMFGIYKQGPTFLGILNIATGNVEEVTLVSDDLDAIAIAEVESIPSLSEWGLMALAIALGALGLSAVRRRKVAV